MSPTDKILEMTPNAPDDDFILFLLFCADRLNKDEPVQAIWSDWKELIAKK